MQALLSGDHALALKVLERDAAIDQLQQQILTGSPLKLPWNKVCIYTENLNRTMVPWLLIKKFLV